MGALEITTQPVEDGRQRVSVQGDLDLHSARRIERTLLERVENGATEVIVDITSCRFVDSTALDLLFSSDLGRARGRFLPVASDRNILQILRWRSRAEAAGQSG